MSNKAITWVFEHSRASGGDLLVLLILADRADDEDSWRCYPGIASIAARARMSERGVRYCLQNLKKLGELTILPPGLHPANTYQILMDQYSSVPFVSARRPGRGEAKIAPLHEKSGTTEAHFRDSTSGGGSPVQGVEEAGFRGGRKPSSAEPSLNPQLNPKDISPLPPFAAAQPEKPNPPESRSSDSELPPALTALLAGKNVVKALAAACEALGVEIRLDANLKGLLKRADDKTRGDADSGRELWEAWRQSLADAVWGSQVAKIPATSAVRGLGFQIMGLGKRTLGPQEPTQKQLERAAKTQAQITGVFRPMILKLAEGAGCEMNGLKSFPDWCWEELEAGYLRDKKDFLNRFQKLATEQKGSMCGSVLRAMLADEKVAAKGRKPSRLVSIPDDEDDEE